eukprot:4343868-Pyramimonas_sp.AAC.1
MVVGAGLLWRQTAGATLLDIKAAFPSLCHDWIFLVFEKMNFPEFVLDAIKTLYAKVTTTILLGGASHCSFRILRGIKQGCPLSGS